MDAVLRGLKRIGRVALGGAIMGTAYATFDDLQNTAIGIFIVPIGTAIIEGLAKTVREKWGVKLPF